MNEPQTIQEQEMDDLKNRIYEILTQFTGTHLPYVAGNYLRVDPETLQVELQLGVDYPGENAFPLMVFFNGSRDEGLRVCPDSTHKVASKFVNVDE